MLIKSERSIDKKKHFQIINFRGVNMPEETIQVKKKIETENFHEKFERLCGFQIEDLTSWNRFVKLMYRPTDPSSLGITRMLFGN